MFALLCTQGYALYKGCVQPMPFIGGDGGAYDSPRLLPCSQSSLCMQLLMELRVFKLALKNLIHDSLSSAFIAVEAMLLSKYESAAAGSGKLGEQLLFDFLAPSRGNPSTAVDARLESIQPTIRMNMSCFGA